MAYCKNCDKNVEPVRIGNRFRCPDCNLYVKASDEEKKEPQVTEIPQREIEEESSKKLGKGKRKEPKVVQDGNTKLIITPKTVNYDAADLHMGEILIDHGFARDLNDLSRKNMKLAFSLMNMGAVGKQFNTMEINNEPNPERTMKQIQEQEMMKAYIEGMKKGNQTDPMMTMMMMRMLENQGKGKESGSNGFMDKMLEIQMLKTVMGGNNSETANLQSQIAELKHNMQMQQILSQQQQQQQGNQSSQEFMRQMELIRAERDQAIKKAEVDAQKERDRNLQLVFENRKNELENRLRALEKEKQNGSSGTFSNQSIKNMKEEIAAIKDMSKLLGDKEKGTGEMLLENLGPLAEKVIPALVEMGKNKQQQLPPYYPPEPMIYPPDSNPSIPEQLPQEFQLPPNQEPSSEMTATEKQMSDSNRYVEY